MTQLDPDPLDATSLPPEGMILFGPPRSRLGRLEPPASVHMGMTHPRPGVDLTGYAEPPASGDVDAAWEALRNGLSKAYVAADIDDALATARPRIESAIRAESTGTLDVFECPQCWATIREHHPALTDIEVTP